VYKVYPYAVAAGFIMQDIDAAMSLMRSKEAKQMYKRHKEDELNKKFKGELVNLTMSQGQVLVKLIARQTGKPCYQIIKDLKGGLNARIWQTVAILFDNNLKNNYDPMGEDEAMESIVLEIERSGHFEMKR
jgi:nucleoside diphosphate kinase